MIYIVVERLFPTVSTLIKQVEPPSHVAQPDSVAAVAVLYLGEIAVVAHKREVAVAFREAEPYERLMAVAEAMLVGVLNEAYQQQGGNRQARRRYVERCLHLGLARATEIHEFDVVLHEFHFFCQGHRRFVAVVDGISQQVA